MKGSTGVYLHVRPYFSSSVPYVWIVFVMGDRWPHSNSVVGCCFKDLFDIACCIHALLPSSFFSIRLVSVHVVHPYTSIDTTAA